MAKSPAKTKPRKPDRFEAAKPTRLVKDAKGHLPIPPPQLLELIHDFLKSYNYIKACHGIRTDNQKRPGHSMILWKWSSKGYPDLLQIFSEWREQNPEKIEVPAEKEALETSAEGESPSDSSDSSSASSSSDDDAMSVDNVPAPADASLKRKDSSTSESSSSSSSSGSDEEDATVAPIEASNLTQEATPSSSASPSSDSSSGSSSESEVEEAPLATKAKLQPSKVSNVEATSPTSPSSSASSSSASSESNQDDVSEGSSSESEVEEPKREEDGVMKITKTTKSSASSSEDSESASSSDNSDESEAEAVPKAAEVAKLEDDEALSDSSATLAGVAPSTSAKGSSKKGKDTLVYNKPLGKAKRKRDPDAVGDEVRVPATANNFKKLKKQKIPFSRIPADIKVDERFASNKYVPYDYANKAHEDLIVTKGKGFTKEKNKKKRGSYKGGLIDVGGGRGIKFED